MIMKNLFFLVSENIYNIDMKTFLKCTTNVGEAVILCNPSGDLWVNSVMWTYTCSMSLKYPYFDDFEQVFGDQENFFIWRNGYTVDSL